MAPRALSRYDLMTWGFAAAALLLILHLKLLPALIAGLLVYVLVNLLTPVLRNRMLWGEGPRRARRVADSRRSSSPVSACSASPRPACSATATTTSRR